MDQPKIERLLRILQLLMSNCNYTVPQMATILEISPRTVYRYISSLKEVGFVVEGPIDGVYKFAVRNEQLKKISDLLYFTEEEAVIINQLIEGLDENNMLKNNLREKLASVYDLVPIKNIVAKRSNGVNINNISLGIKQKRQLIFKNYSSSNSSDVRHRYVEAFEFTTNFIQVWCYDLEDGKNKVFKTARIEAVEVTDTAWTHEAEHEKGFVDVFRMTGTTKIPVKLRLNTRAHNLLLEEFPLAQEYMNNEAENSWIFETEVTSLHGVGRFVLGLCNDVEIIESPALENYIIEQIEERWPLRKRK